MDQVILPAEVVRKVKKLSKEIALVKKEIRRAVKVPESQLWFWSKGWQQKERRAERAIKQGKVKTFSSIDGLIKDLNS